MQKRCGVCLVVFKSTVQRRDGKGSYERAYCSKSCGTRAKGHPAVKRCSVCGSLMSLRRSLAQQHTCSIACRAIYLKWYPPHALVGRQRVRGYIKIHYPEHPCADKKGYVWEHRLVMEWWLGRTLAPVEQVHHDNEVKDDNDHRNLVLFASNAAHTRFHMRDREARVRTARKRQWNAGVKRCRQCRQEFAPPKEAYYKQHLGRGVYCSRACADLGHRSRVARTCERCGQGFEVMAYLVAQGYGRFCSNACKVFGTALVNRPSRLIACASCGQMFKPKGTKQRCCSQRCGYAARRQGA